MRCTLRTLTARSARALGVCQCTMVSGTRHAHGAVAAVGSRRPVGKSQKESRAQPTQYTLRFHSDAAGTMCGYGATHHVSGRGVDAYPTIRGALSAATICAASLVATPVGEKSHQHRSPVDAVVISSNGPISLKAWK